MSPYQQQVIDATLSEFDRNQAIQQHSYKETELFKQVLMVVDEKV
jgi:hypothetical protein